MEVICHVFLGHQPNRIGIEATDPKGNLRSRDYQQADEEEAYGVGAAALVPYATLKRFVYEGKTSPEIARHFQVSRELIEYRLKVTKLWPLYKQHAQERTATGGTPASRRDG
jgi:Zn-dependent peptidase ImmA (M78 family)